jgi:hypothetical protein
MALHVSILNLDHGVQHKRVYASLLMLMKHNVISMLHPLKNLWHYMSPYLDLDHHDVHKRVYASCYVCLVL